MGRKRNQPIVELSGTLEPITTQFNFGGKIQPIRDSARIAVRDKKMGLRKKNLKCINDIVLIFVHLQKLC